ncbi:MAG: iron ABC transporter permease [Cellulosilyticum sp.]|nr:iron ABC transporter permease [Cellulosilyticum sp.]
MINQKRKAKMALIGLMLLLLLSIVVSVSVGSADITVLDSLKLLVSKIPIIGQLVEVDHLKSTYEVIVWRVRMPRILQAALVGSNLAIVGCTFQAVFRNPLADPSILGVSSGASLGATLGILSGITLNFLGLGATSILAFIGALLTVVLVYRVGTLGSRMVVANLLLVGTAVSTLLSSLISLFMIYNREQLEKVYLWTLGSFSAANWDKVGFLAIITWTGIVIISLFGKDLNILLTGDEVAASLGVDTVKVKKILMLIGSLLVAASVSVSGAIGFVGLIVPQCMRLCIGSDHRLLLPFSVLGGATFMVICDTLSRTIAQPTEIPVGVITAVFGAPYFIYLLYRQSKNGKV